MTKVLYFVDRLRRGGIQSVLYNMLCVNNGRIAFEVLTLDDGMHYELEDAIQALGVTVHKLHGIWIKSFGDIAGYLHAVDRFFETHHDYDAVHINTSSKNAWILYYAKRYGIPVRIAHAHNTGFQTTNLLKIALGDLLKGFLYNVATHHIACSSEAGHWLYGKRPFTVLPNGIISEHYAYNKQWHQELRSDLGVSDECLLLGCVGRFVRQKNQAFLIPVMEHLATSGREVKLLLIGSGDLEEDLRARVNASSAAHNVLFVGFKEDCQRWYSALDLLLMPSLYEGLPVVLLEAQAAELPALIADTITQEAVFSPRVTTLPIAHDAHQAWADAIRTTTTDPQRGTHDYIALTDFEMYKVLGKLAKIYAGNA